MDQICPKRVFPAENEKSKHHHWILHIRISLSIKFHLKLKILNFWPSLPKKGISGRKRKKWTELNSAYSNLARCHISRCYGTSRPIKRELTIYGTARPRGKFANKNAMALLGQVRESWPSMAPLGHVELTKTLWHF